MSQEVKSFFAEVSEKLAEIEKGGAIAWWNLATTGKEEFQKEVVEWQMKSHALFHDRKAFEKVKAWKEAGSDDPLLDREIQVMFRSYLANQEDEKTAEEVAKLEAELEGDYSNYRGEVDGKKVSNNDILEIFKRGTDPERSRRAWEASKGIGPLVRDKVLKLAELRNGIANELGYRDYYSFALELQEIDEKELFGILDELELLTREPFRSLKAVMDERRAKKYGIAVSELRPWHYNDPFFQEPLPVSETDLDGYFEGKNIEALTTETYDRVGMDIRPVLANSDLYEREGKNQHAFCTSIGRTKDVRVLCNIKSNHNWMGTMLHEYGHAVYDYYTDFELPYVLIGPAHTNSTEAIAMLFGRLNSNPDWLKSVLGADERSVDNIAGDLFEEQRAAMLVFVRWMMVMTNFERALYRDPSQDLNKLWWDLVEKYQMLTRPEGRDMPDWATKLHIALAPVYYHNYMLGEMTASQLQHHIEHVIGGGKPFIEVREGGEFLIEKLFRQGRKRPWNEALEFCTGEKLKPAYFVEQFVKGRAKAG
ncbi:MAG: M2 family metallopeptidase [bacterium]